MALTLRLFRTVASRPWLRWSALPLAALAVIGAVLSQTTPPNIPAVTLSAAPLYAKGARAKPTLTLDLSVEYPTVGAQYLGATSGSSVDNTYSPSATYPGYFDTESCYTYNDTPTADVPTGGAVADYKRFDRAGASASATAANPRSCSAIASSFSGNFMNWASSSAIDVLRYGLTGGDRWIDTTALTVLQRAVLPNIGVSYNFWNGSNFPDKQLIPSQAVGALPAALLGTYTGTVHVANCLNRIHFGTTATGSCAAPGANSNLGVLPAATGPVAVGVAPFPPAAPTPSGNGWTYCAAENATCSFSGIQQVAFGVTNALITSWRYMSASNGVSCTNGAFGGVDPAYGTVKACYIRPDPSNPPWSPPVVYGTTALSSDYFFYTRVSVCGSSGGALTDPRTGLCFRYPSGSYKPVGNMQLHSDSLRVSVFSYLNDPTGDPLQRYGGVLRVPMKYVGPTTYDASFNLVSGANPNQEWDPTTGIFKTNPDSNTTVGSGPLYTGPNLSGAINYINQFGRTGIFGQYKTYDPVSELYYESLRYIQGLQPTPQATTGFTSLTAPLLQDGFPVTTTWVDPQPAVAGSTDYSCVKNNIFTIGDIHTHNDASIPGNANGSLAYNQLGLSNFLRPAATTGTGPYPDNQPDFYFWMKVVGGFESGNAVTYTDGQGNTTRSTSNPLNPSPISGLWGMQDQVPFTDGNSNYIAGIAYWANTHDIRGTGWTSNIAAQRPGMRATTYMLDVNENGASTSVSAHNQNQFYLAAKYGGFNDTVGNGNPFVQSGATIDNTEWAGSPTGTQATNYFLSSSASAVLTALNTIFAKVTSESNSIAGGASTSQQLTTVPGYIFQAQFDPSSWSGDLDAFMVSMDGSGNVIIGNSATDHTAAWQASISLAAKASAASPAGSTRNIIVGKRGQVAAPVAMNFLWGSLDTTTQTALQTPPYAAANAPLDPVSTGQARLSYLRGDRSNEAPNGLSMRTRSSILGDIVNSGVAYSGAPSQSITDPSYASFYATNLNRTHALFVGANDGMLHAFNPDQGDGNQSGGDELFAYIPSWVVPNLANLTSTNYVHQSYVDSTPVVAEAQVGSVWKTVLVSGTGGGGQGVFALDVTNPAAFTTANVMWEFTDADDPDLGNVVGKPQILKLNTTSATTGAKYFAVVASGVNNYVNDGHYSTTGHPAIFLLDLSKAAGVPWTLGSNYFKISMWQQSTFSTVSASMASGMTGFASLLGSDGSVSAIYAGDLQGNLWKLDFTKATSGSGSWNFSTLSYFSNASGPMPMYIAQDAASPSNRQPIMIDPALVYGPNHGIIVAFGTGKFDENSDLSNSRQQSMYAVFDNISSTPDSSPAASATTAISGRGRLVAGTTSISTTTGTVTVTVPTFAWGRPSADNDSSSRSGWYVDFPTTGERQISDFVVSGGNLIAGSVIPPVSSCGNGSGYLYNLSALAGSGTGQVSTVGILGQPLVLQVGSAQTVASGTTGIRSETTFYVPIAMGAGGSVQTPQTSSTALSGRLSWRNVTNYQCVKNSSTGVCQ